MKKADRIKTAEQICENYSTGKFTIESCCRNAGIEYKTFTNWIKENSDISELYIKSKGEKQANHCKELVNLSLTALEKKLSFSKIVDIRTEINELGKVTKRIEFEKTIVPAPADIAIVLNLFYSHASNNKQVDELIFFEYDEGSGIKDGCL